MATVVFDKTGTFTQGRPTLAEVGVSPANQGFPDAEELLALGAYAEQYSSNVLAASVVNAAQNHGLELTRPAEASESATEGVSVLVGEHRLVVGTRSLISQFKG